MSAFELTIEATREVSRVRHQLALGLSFIDSNSLQGTLGSLICRLDSIGGLPMEQVFQPHRRDRQALRFEGAIKKRMNKLVADGVATTWVMCAFGTRNAASGRYLPELDPGVYVPRRLSMELVLNGGVPASSTANMRAPWLWPGASYPFAAASTLVRGRVLRGLSINNARPLPWARLFATVPDTELVFGNAQLVGCAHGDGRGEYVLALDARASTGAALKNPLKLRLWAFAAPAGPSVEDPLAALPIEPCAALLDSKILKGLAVPTGYSQQQSRVLELRLGETLSGTSTEFLFAP